MIEELSHRVWERPAFKADYHDIVNTALRRGFHLQNGEHGGIDDERLAKLVQAAAILAASSHSAHKEAAYRIATSAWELFAGDYNNLTSVVELVLSRLGNFPGIQVVARGSKRWHRRHAPTPIWLEGEARAQGNQVEALGKRVVLTDFQRRLWDGLESGRPVAVTAPTSAGKSFALQRYVAQRSLEGGWCLYIVPTRALINEVSASFAQLLGNKGKEGRAVCSIPIPPTELNFASGIYVLTQERLQALLDTGDSPVFTLAVIDEAQTIGDGARGILLETVLPRLFAASPGLRVLFGSPQTANPEIYGSLLLLDDMLVVRSTDSPVSQNLVSVQTDPDHRDIVSLSVQWAGETHQLGQVRLGNELYDDDQTLAVIAAHFGKGQRNLIYGGGQAKCETLAGLVQQLVHGTSETPEDPPSSLRAFSEFLREHIHPDFLLASTVLHGVAFHYGNLPSVVRQTIEELFQEGELTYLVTTSTLLQGVNLPARNLFLHNPTKGRDWDSKKEIPISSIEFWNLAGRAGRLGKEFEGNVFLVDYDRWIGDPVRGEREQTLQSATQQSLDTQRDAVLAYASDKDHQSGGRNSLVESTFARLVNESRRGRLDTMLERLAPHMASSVRSRIRDSIENATAILNLPEELAERHPTVSPIRLQELLDYLEGKIRREGPERFMPPHPLRPWNETLPRLLRQFKRIHSRFQKLPGADRSEYFFAPLALRWMRGEPLARLISDAYAFKAKRNKRRPKIATVIREVLANVEQDLRYRYVKYTSAYEDVLKEALRRTDHLALLEKIPPIPLFLELGASSQSMISLVSLGLSRTSASVLTGVAPNKDMGRAESERWLARINLRGLGVSKVVTRELARLGLVR